MPSGLVSSGLWKNVLPLSASPSPFVSSCARAEALAKIYASKPDVIFLDVMMPKLDGFELCNLIKQDEELRDIYVILFTAKGQAKDRQRAVEVGANEYIMKPFRPPLVIEKLRAIFGETLV